ncbi:MAG: hypothetical protein WED00_07385 [Aquisalimonadaceae bacterium]
MKTSVHAFWLIPMLFIAGCAVVPPDRDPADRAPAEEREAAPEQEADRAAPAVVALLDQADTASADGEHGRAAALLERALRIDSTNPVLWHNLAVVRYRETNYAQAESMAMRSNRYADGRRELMMRNWQLIAVSRELSGNSKGAEEAKARAKALQDGGGR